MLPSLVTSGRMYSAMNAEAIRSDWVGQVIDGRFTLLKWLGGSERSSVFLTELPGPQARKAAIKLILADDAEAESFAAGWAVTRPLSHPNLMRLFQTGRCEMEDGVMLYAVSEYADEVLSEILPERPLTPPEAREMLAPIIDALYYLHGKGLVHGHLKPSNILVVEDRLKLSGDSLQLEGETGKRSSTRSIYEAPEAAEGTISPAADVWSLGATLVEALTQQPPAWDRSVEEDPVVPESMPQPFAGIARGSLRADPLGRCSLANAKTWLDGDQPDKEQTGQGEKKAAARNRAPMLVAAGIVVVAVAAVLFVGSHKTQTAPQTAQAAPDVQQQAPAAAPNPTPTQDQTPAADAAAPPQAQDQAPAGAAAAQTPAQAQPQPQNQVPAAAPLPRQQTPVSESHASNAIPFGGPAANGAVAQQVMPDVLPKALASIHGSFKVRIRVTVDPSGNVSGATFDSEGPSQYFAKAAMQAAQKWKFKPAQAAGQAASSAWILQFLFTRDGAEVTHEAAR